MCEIVITTREVTLRELF